MTRWLIVSLTFSMLMVLSCKNQGRNQIAHAWLVTSVTSKVDSPSQTEGALITILSVALDSSVIIFKETKEYSWSNQGLGSVGSSADHSGHYRLDEQSMKLTLIPAESDTELYTVDYVSDRILNLENKKLLIVLKKLD